MGIIMPVVSRGSSERGVIRPQSIFVQNSLVTNVDQMDRILT